MEGGGFLPECYVTKVYQVEVECDKPLHRGWGPKRPFVLLRTF